MQFPSVTSTFNELGELSVSLQSPPSNPHSTTLHSESQDPSATQDHKQEGLHSGTGQER